MASRTCAALLALLALAACGVDGAPTRPEPREQPQTAATITLSGEASAGVVGGT